MKGIALYIAIAFGVLLSSCSAVKQCKAPELDLPATFSYGVADTLTMADVEWWKFYADSTLCFIITRTLDNNKNILAAAARVEQARQLYGIDKSNMLPELGGRAYGNQETNDYYGEKHVTDPEYGLKATISWEADLWGKLRWAKRKGLANYVASIEEERAMRITLIADVASAYIRLMALENELTIVRRTLATRQEGVKQAKLRFEGGLTSETVYQQAKVEYATAAALIPNLERQIQTTKSSIALLMGEYAGTDIPVANFDIEAMLPDSLSIGIPSQLLRRRPDVCISEARLKAAMADVGVAYADRFPVLNFTVTGGVENNALDHFFKSPFTYIAGALAGPIFDFGRKQKKYRASIAAYEQARYAYEQKVLEVFKETSDAVVTYTSIRQTAALRMALREAALKYVDLAHLQYRSGSINYIDVLDAQRRYFDAQIGVTNAVRDEYLSLIQLYKTLGGGWQIRH